MHARGQRRTVCALWRNQWECQRVFHKVLIERAALPLRHDEVLPLNRASQSAASGLELAQRAPKRLRLGCGPELLAAGGGARPTGGGGGRCLDEKSHSTPFPAKVPV